METKLPGVLLIEPDIHTDDRGYFLEAYNEDKYCELLGADIVFVQDNQSRSRKGTLRGLHFQSKFPQGKLVRVTTGSVLDVVVDINPVSRTFKQWLSTQLDDTNHRQLYVPPGYAHGFCVTSDIADFQYKVTAFYHPEDEYSIIWNDPQLNIDWQIENPVVSAKDAKSPTLADYLSGQRTAE